MSDTASLNSDPFGNPAVFPVDHNGTSYEFLFPDVDNTRQHVKRILQGRDYRVLPLKGYAVETIMDVGANIGAFAFYMALQFPDARIESFEPSPGAITFLKDNTKPFANVTVHPVGLFSDDTEATLYDGAAQSLQASLYQSAGTVPSGAQVSLRHAGAVFDDLSVDRLSILKADTEGAEVPILSALGDRIGCIDQIYVEYHSEEDRLAIESLLTRTHVLAGAQATGVHLGVNHYLHKQLLAAFPVLERAKITRR